MPKKPTTEDPEITLLRENFDVGNAAADGMTLTQFLVRNDIDGSVELHADRDPLDRLSDDARRYQMGDLIAKGGMATVWLAYNQTLDVKVAIKFIRMDLASVSETFIIAVWMSRMAFDTTNSGDKLVLIADKYRL